MKHGDGSESGPKKLNSFKDFWPFYVHEHRAPRNRRLHFFGTSLALLLLFIAAFSGVAWFLLAALFAGYFFAWIGHFFVENNRPATWEHPLYSLLGDFRMFYLTLNGKMDAEIDRLRSEWND